MTAEEKKERARIANRKFYEKNKESEKARTKQWRKDNKQWYDEYVGKNREKIRSNSRKCDHNILPEEFESKFKEQDGKCAICSKGGIRLDVDHDHRCCPGKKNCGKCNRGLLCRSCNTFIGLAKDSIELLESAIQYLRRHK